MDNFEIKTLLPREAIAWQEKLRVMGILNSRLPESSLGVYIGVELAGVITFSPGHLIGLLVKPEFRRMGIGRALLIEALDQLVPHLRDGEFVVAEMNQASGKLFDSLPEKYRSRIYERGWYD